MEEWPRPHRLILWNGDDVSDVKPDDDNGDWENVNGGVP
jgi:hypothetical protein